MTSNARERNQPMREGNRLVSALLLAGLLIAGAAGAQVRAQSAEAVAASEAAFMLRDGVVVDPGAGRIYAMSVEEGVEALSLDGGVIWRSEAAARPLGMYGDLLIAQRAASPAGEMSLAFLDRTGAAAGDAAMRLAPGAVAAVADGPHGRYYARSRLDDGVPVVDWEYTPLRSGAVPGAVRAAPGSPAVQPQAPTPLGGAIALDPASGAQTIVSSERPSARASRVQARPVADDFIPGALQAMFSVDRRHVLVTERVDPRDWLEYRWSIFDAETRSKVGEVPNRLGGASFFVDSQTIFFDSSPYTRSSDEGTERHGLELMAMSLESGELVWSREVRDTRFYGPFPH